MNNYFFLTDLWNYFKDSDGSTNWQYVANWSSGILILLLLAVAIILYFSRRQLNIANRALTRINDELEQRVRERTARLRASETYIKSILESMPLMLAGLGKTGRVTQWNKEAEKITGVKAVDILDTVLWETYPVMPVSKEQVAEALEQRTTLHMRRSQRGMLHFEITVYPLDGQVDDGVVILIDNVTQQVLAENKLIEKDKMSQMGELASTLAHDINMPLNAVIEEISQAQDLLAGSGSDWNHEQFQPLRSLLIAAQDQSQRAAAITRNLLDFASSRDDGRRLCDIPGIVDHALELASNIFSFTQGLKFTDISIMREYEPNLPQIPCFSSELQQVFLSLLRHSFYALRKMEQRDPRIRVKVLTSYDALWIKIQHNGVGLSAQEQLVIFEPYFSDEPLNPDIHCFDYDAGKRLSFSYFIITEHHQGQMAVTSEPDDGTTFHMELQLHSVQGG